MKKQLAIKLHSIYKKYIIHHEKPTLVEHLIKGKNESFFALQNINLEIEKGEKVGITGRNGSGKTTLLKIIAGISSPSKGNVETNGKIVSLIDLEAGFHPDLTGEENIYLNGLLLGMNKMEIYEKFDRIISFADIGRFIDAPLYTYSEGMKLRLGFSVAIHSEPDILILDEGFGAGDIDFQKKAQIKLQQFIRKGKTILMVSHILYFLKQYCTRILIMDNGQIIKDGSVKVISHYQKQYLSGQ